MDPEGAPPSLPPGVLAVRAGPGGNCSSAGSAIDVLFYGSMIAGALAVALAAAFPPDAPVTMGPQAAPNPGAPDAPVPEASEGEGDPPEAP
jgi:hypothetical protein